MARLRAALALLVAMSCTPEPSGPGGTPADDGDADTDTDTDTDEDTDAEPERDTTNLVGRHDGFYTVTLQRDGGHFALGTVDITLNDVTADIRSNDGLVVAITGDVLPSGAIDVTGIDASTDVDIGVVEAGITSGVIEATYTLDGVEGTLTGTRDGARLAHDPVDEYDGSYEIALVRDDEEVANTVLMLKGGAFETLVVAGEEAWTLGGHVTSDGTLVLTESDDGSVIAEATIDQDTFQIEGIYRAGDRVGRLFGRRSD